METLLSDIINNNQWISLFIDIGLIAGLIALWLIWFRNGQRQQRLEQLLAETARQLDEATLHLQQATRIIEQLKQREDQTRETTAAPKEPNIKRAVQKPRATEEAKLPPENSSQATMVLRMHREGEEPESIADRLDIPLAQVKLLLKLYDSKSAA